jgi:DNA-binding NtrC family response regulator
MKPGQTILVVEDDAAMREMVVSLLRDEGLDATPACDGEDALDALRAGSFEAILSDVRMPRKSGLELLSDVRRFWPHSKVIIMTAFGSAEDAEVAIRAGAFDLIAKPFRRAELLAVLARALK